MMTILTRRLRTPVVRLRGANELLVSSQGVLFVQRVVDELLTRGLVAFFGNLHSGVGSLIVF